MRRDQRAKRLLALRHIEEQMAQVSLAEVADRRAAAEDEVNAKAAAWRQDAERVAPVAGHTLDPRLVDLVLEQKRQHEACLREALMRRAVVERELQSAQRQAAEAKHAKHRAEHVYEQAAAQSAVHEQKITQAVADQAFAQKKRAPV